MTRDYYVRIQLMQVNPVTGLATELCSATVNEDVGDGGCERSVAVYDDLCRYATDADNDGE